LSPNTVRLSLEVQIAAFEVMPLAGLTAGHTSRA